MTVWTTRIAEDPFGVRATAAELDDSAEQDRDAREAEHEQQAPAAEQPAQRDLDDGAERRHRRTR